MEGVDEFQISSQHTPRGGILSSTWTYPEPQPEIVAYFYPELAWMCVNVPSPPDVHGLLDMYAFSFHARRFNSCVCTCSKRRTRDRLLKRDWAEVKFEGKKGPSESRLMRVTLSVDRETSICNDSTLFLLSFKSHSKVSPILQSCFAFFPLPINPESADNSCTATAGLGPQHKLLQMSLKGHTVKLLRQKLAAKRKSRAKAGGK